MNMKFNDDNRVFMLFSRSIGCNLSILNISVLSMIHNLIAIPYNIYLLSQNH